MADLKTVLEQIENTKWWMEEAPGSIFLFDYIMKTFVHAEKITGQPNLQKHLYITKNNIAFEISPYKEKEENFERIYENELEKQGYFLQLIEPWRKLRTDLLGLNEVAANKEKIKEMNDEKLKKFTERFLQTGFDSVIYGAFIECIDPFTENLPLKFQKKYKINNDNLQKIISTLSVQKERSFLTQEKLDFLHFCLGEITEEEYINKWFWIKSNYRESVEITKKELEERAEKELNEFGKGGVQKIIDKTVNQEEELLKEKEQLINKLKLKKEDKILFQLLEQFALHIDIRKESMLRHTYARDKFLQNLTSRLPYSLDELRSMRDIEMLKIMNGEKVDLEKIKKRGKISAIYYTPNSETEWQGKEAQQIYDTFMKTLRSEETKGVVASAPVKKLIGKVSVVMDVNREKFEPGTILVTSMTRPEFMPMMRKAKAVITDEGGITCHAAIVSRELGIPCIIGTKNATKNFKNGDEVEMDLKRGVIKRIN